jgi:hypothetical protein
MKVVKRVPKLDGGLRQTQILGTCMPLASRLYIPKHHLKLSWTVEEEMVEADPRCFSWAMMSVSEILRFHDKPIASSIYWGSNWGSQNRFQLRSED